MSGWTLAFELSNPTSGSVVAPLTSLAPLSVVAPMSSVAPLSRAECASSIALGRVEHPGTPHARAIVVDTEHVAPALPRSTEDDLFPAIDRLLRRNGLSPRDLGGEGGRIAVSVGPGGYTGLRIACAAAKVLADSVGAACVSVPTALVALRARATALQGSAPSASEKNIGIALASKSDSAWLYIDGWPDPAAPRFITAANVGELAAHDHLGLLIADSFLPVVIRDACAVHGITIQPPALSAAACLEVSAHLPDIDPVALVPIYAREPDAVTQWRARHSGNQQSSKSAEQQIKPT